jgi:hypothetical protein
MNDRNWHRQSSPRRRATSRYRQIATTFAVPVRHASRWFANGKTTKITVAVGESFAQPPAASMRPGPEQQHIKPRRRMALVSATLHLCISASLHEDLMPRASGQLHYRDAICPPSALVVAHGEKLACRQPNKRQGALGELIDPPSPGNVGSSKQT